MKQILTFFAGVIVGALAYAGMQSLSSDKEEEEPADAVTELIGGAIKELTSDRNGMTFFKSPGDCIGTYKYEVDQVLEPGYALAYELEYMYGEDLKTYKKVLIYDANKKPFYDGQVIAVPKGYCARHIGTYKYGFRGEDTAPIVEILKK